jgi:tetratricopeptide (TPR) repeat protein
MEQQLQSPERLLFAHRYGEAFAAFDVRLSEANEKSELHLISALTWRARALLCLGRAHEALDDLQRANRIELLDRGGESQTSLPKIGAIQWMLGRRNNAIQTLRHAVDGVKTRKIKRAETFGARGEGLLLWYFAVSANNGQVCKQALDFLRWGESKCYDHTLWPSPVVLYVLNELQFDDLLEKIEGDFRKLDQPPLADWKKDLWRRRQLCLAFFYAGATRRARGDEQGCFGMLARCAALANPILEEEWYLARAEVEARKDVFSGSK